MALKTIKRTRFRERKADINDLDVPKSNLI